MLEPTEERASGDEPLDVSFIPPVQRTGGPDSRLLIAIKCADTDDIGLKCIKGLHLIACKNQPEVIWERKRPQPTLLV